MELQPVVGAECARCHARILVDADGKNCQRCGLAIHRACSKAHRPACAGKPVLATVRHDYDEVPPLMWTARLIAALAAGAFLAALGLGLLTASVPADKTPWPARVPVGWTALASGLLLFASGYAWERARQHSRERAE